VQVHLEALVAMEKLHWMRRNIMEVVKGADVA
jgi:hypothetical protein